MPVDNGADLKEVQRYNSLVLVLIFLIFLSLVMAFFTPSGHFGCVCLTYTSVNYCKVVQVVVSVVVSDIAQLQTCAISVYGDLKCFNGIF